MWEEAGVPRDSSYPGGVSNFPTRVFMRSCGNSEQCSDLTVLRTPYIRMVTSNKCCSGGNCSPQPPTDWSVVGGASPNGLVCQGCLNVTCKEYRNVQCRGSENQCFTYYSPQLDERGSVTMAGCATRSACNLYLGSDNAKTECYGESPPNSSSVLPVLPVLLVIAALLSISL
ncbi:phospholipase A2 inhibitor NAI-like isoform X3 [Hyperolius riggenbachi]|uniref:phospholipase A2 inhibitor NAI-like isoform X3 n=1 Tax=Hyperolius riggenbachi TaxID=752182 RepID=UPI0035A38CA1